MSATWIAGAPEEWIEYDTGHGTLLFDRRSRLTHLLSDDALATLSLLRQRAHTMEELAEHFDAEPSSVGQSGVVERMREIVSGLDAVGLAEPGP